MKNKPTNQVTIVSRDKKFDTFMQRQIRHKQFSSTIIQSKFELWKKSINPHRQSNGQQLPERSPAGRRLISCYQLQIKTRPRELLFPRNKKKNFQPSNLPFHLRSQPFSSSLSAASFTVFSRNYSKGGGA